MPKSKPKPSAPTKPALDAKKPGLEVKPVKDLEPNDSQSENVRGGQAFPRRPFSDATLKTQVLPLRDALVKLRELRF